MKPGEPVRDFQEERWWWWWWWAGVEWGGVMWGRVMWGGVVVFISTKGIQPEIGSQKKNQRSRGRGAETPHRAGARKIFFSSAQLLADSTDSKRDKRLGTKKNSPVDSVKCKARKMHLSVKEKGLTSG